MPKDRIRAANDVRHGGKLRLGQQSSVQVDATPPPSMAYFPGFGWPPMSPTPFSFPSPYPTMAMQHGFGTSALSTTPWGFGSPNSSVAHQGPMTPMQPSNRHSLLAFPSPIARANSTARSTMALTMDL